MDKTLKEALAKALVGKSQAQLAREIGVTPQYLGDVIHDKRGPNEAILRKIGLRKATGYVKLQGGPT